MAVRTRRKLKAKLSPHVHLVRRAKTRTAPKPKARKQRR